MAIDEGMAEVMRADLADLEGLQDRKMFGGLCFMHHGHMICGIHKDGAIYRVGKPGMARALALEGTGPMTFTGRPMGGFVDLPTDAFADDELRAELTRMACAHTASLPPKA